MKILVGTANPAKVSAVEKAARFYFPDAVVMGMDAPSGVRPMPQTDEEGVKGCRNRALACLSTDPTCDMGIGIEGTLSEKPWGFFLVTWCVAINREGLEVVASGQNVPVPSPFYKALRDGVELSSLVEEYGIPYVHSRGLLSHLTHDAYSREDNMEDAMLLTLQAFTHPELYNLKKKKIAV